jgi:hypothetical protein
LELQSEQFVTCMWYNIVMHSNNYCKLDRQSSFSKTINFPLFLHIKKFIFEKLDCHL